MDVPLVGIDANLAGLLAQLASSLAELGYECAVARQAGVLSSGPTTASQRSGRVVTLVLPNELFERFTRSMQALSKSPTVPTNDWR